MPHNLYLHSALVQSRNIERTDAGIKQAIKFNRIDSTIALNIAFLVNAAILIVAASVFFKTGNTQVGELHEAYKLLPSFLGNVAPILFAVALIAAGQSSTVTGTLAGQIVMEGYLRLRINPLIRRLITRLIAIIPAVIVILIYGDDEVDSLLIFSQVILSLQLGFAIIPLIHFVSGKFAINNLTKVGAWVIAIVLIYLNFKMLATEVEPVFAGNNFWSQAAIVISGLFFSGLLLYIVIEPSISRRRSLASIKIHPEMESLILDIPQYHKIAIALDFSENDQKLISYALGQGNIKTEYVLVHIVESASANIWASKSDDYETRKDQKQLTAYVDQLMEKGFSITGVLGFKNRAKEIVRLVNESNADMLVVGTHGHKGLKDIIYGQTVDSVRHSLKIPVLMVNIKDTK
jgi:manganese transport protein